MEYKDCSNDSTIGCISFYMGPMLNINEKTYDVDSKVLFFKTVTGYIITERKRNEDTKEVGKIGNTIKRNNIKCF
jgi:hypothetical protein